MKRTGGVPREAKLNAVRREIDCVAMMANTLKVDDPMHPYSLDHPWHSWVEFVEQVARPLVDAMEVNDDAEVFRLMQLYRTASPYSICISLVMAANRAGRVEQQGDRT